jgi:hypothetical protein
VRSLRYSRAFLCQNASPNRSEKQCVMFNMRAKIGGWHSGGGSGMYSEFVEDSLSITLVELVPSPEGIASYCLINFIRGA